jgi:hypothetical protein
MNKFSIFVYYNEHYEHKEEHFAAENRQING